MTSKHISIAVPIAVVLVVVVFIVVGLRVLDTARERRQLRPTSTQEKRGDE